MQSGIRKLNTQNMFYSEIFKDRKNHANASQRMPHMGSYQVKKVSPRYSYNLKFTVLILTYFKAMDGLPNHKGPCRCQFHRKR